MEAKQPRVFYGWWMVGATVLVGLYTGGVIVYGFTAIFEPIIDEFGWSYAAVSFAASLRGAESGLLEPVVGRLVDRWGPRRLIFIGGLFTAAGLFLLSATRSLTMFYGAFVLLAVGMSACGPTSLVTGVASWFRARLGLATGLALSGFGLGGFMLPVMVLLIAQHGWRDAYAMLGAGALALILPMALVFRHRPEDYGCLPDGRRPEPRLPAQADSPTHQPGVDEPQIDFHNAIRTPAFWLLTLALTVLTAANMTAVTHVMPYLDSIGFERMSAGAIATAIPVLSVVGRLGLGALGDRASHIRVAAFAFGAMGLGMLFFAAAPTLGKWPLYLFLPLFGVGLGGGIALRPALMREYFGRRHFGSIFGLVMGVNAIGGIVGPPVAGRIFDTTGDYRPVWVAFAILCAAAVCLVLSARRWKPRASA